jgi:acyl carrier protein
MGTDPFKSQALKALIDEIRVNKQQPPLADMSPGLRLHGDIGFLSLDLVELTVRIDERFEVDLFANGLVHNVGEIEKKITMAEDRRRKTEC